MEDIDISRARFLRLSDKPPTSSNRPLATYVNWDAPDDFAESFATLGWEKTAKKYHTSIEKVAEWAHDAGIDWRIHKKGVKKNGQGE